MLDDAPPGRASSAPLLGGGAARGDRADLALFRAFDADRRRRCLPVGADRAIPVTPVRLRVVEPFRSLFYAPQFVAIHGGHLAAEGLEIALTTAAKGGGTVDALLNGNGDLALGGPHAELRAPRAWGPAPRPLRRGERSQRVLSPEPGATPPLRVVGSRRADGDLVRRRTDAVALHAGGPAPPRCRSGAGDVHPWTLD